MANEKRLIAANDVYALFDKRGFATLHVGDIDTIPRVDAMEVVRCKDCKQCKDVSAIPTIADSLKLACTNGVNWRAVDPNHFCSYGERRSEDDHHRTDYNTLQDAVNAASTE